MSVTVHHGDSRDVLKGMADGSIDSVVCDPPYALVSIGKRFGKDGAAPARAGKTGAYARASSGFMGQKWDTGETAFDPAFWVEVLRVLKPGGHLLAFSGTRTYHRLACAIEDAGFEMRDMIAWLYGSGFPKSHDVSKGIDKAAGATREAIGVNEDWVRRKPNGSASAVSVGFSKDTDYNIYAPATDAARKWEGWGTALKPALEPIVLARKPLGTVGVNVVAEVEFSLRDAGFAGEIRWTNEPANGAVKSASRRTSSSTVRPPVGETSAAPVGGSETGSEERPTARSSALTGGSGARQTLAEAASTTEPLTPSSAPKSSPHTAGAATVAESKSKHSSPSTTSMAAAPNTESAPTAKSMPSCDASISPATDTDCFAGIATGLTGSQALVRISRDKSGAFLWPAGLPKSVPSTSLTVAANVLRHGTGALNIDASRVPSDDKLGGGAVRANMGRANHEGWRRPWMDDEEASAAYAARQRASVAKGEELGRYPANVIHDGSDEVVSLFPESNGSGSARTLNRSGGLRDNGWGMNAAQGDEAQLRDGGSGSVARFFYSAKADTTDRLGTTHPTLKPIDLMAYLVKMITPPGGVVLDPFAGTGTTGVAAMIHGFQSILVEREEQYVADIHRRLKWARGEGRLTAQEKSRHQDEAPMGGLFASIEPDLAQGGGRPGRASSTATSRGTPNRADGVEEVIS